VLRQSVLEVCGWNLVLMSMHDGSCELCMSFIMWMMASQDCLLWMIYVHYDDICVL